VPGNAADSACDFVIEASPLDGQNSFNDLQREQRWTQNTPALGSLIVSAEGSG
jgi:hypothetical protein